jgi:hypothetical protein
MQAVGAGWRLALHGQWKSMQWGSWKSHYSKRKSLPWAAEGEDSSHRQFHWIADRVRLAYTKGSGRSRTRRKRDLLSSRGWEWGSGERWRGGREGREGEGRKRGRVE